MRKGKGIDNKVVAHRKSENFVTTAQQSRENTHITIVYKAI